MKNAINKNTVIVSFHIVNNIAYRERIGANYDKDKNYLFILGEDASRSDRDAQGFMPLGGRFGYLFRNQIAADQINSIAAHELGHGIWALKHTFDNDYGNITVNTTDNLMDYTPGAAHLAKWQWEIIRYPALFTDPFGGDEEGEYTKSDADLMAEIIQKIRCAYASNVTSIFITVPTANGISRKIKLHEIEINVIPQIYLDKSGVEKIGSYYGIFHLYNNYKKETKIDNKVYFEFGAGLTVVLPNVESATVFETFINNFDFSAEINSIEELVNEKKPILSVIYNASYCVLKELSVNAIYALINELADKTFLTEDYENIIINIIRAAKSESYSLENKKLILSKFLSIDVFNKFMKDIDNFNGLDNADNFVFELADLCQQVYADDYVELDRLFINTQHAIHEYSISNVPIYFWNIVSGRVDREKNIYKFKTDVNQKDNYMIYPRGEYEAYSGRYKVLAGRMVYVYISYNDLDFVKKSTVLRIPAFELAYLLDMELTKLKLSVANKIFSAITIYSGIANFASSSLIGKFLLSYSIAKSAMTIIDEDYKEYIKQTCGNIGHTFVNGLDKIDLIFNIYSTLAGTRYAIEDGKIIQGFFELWDPVYDKLKLVNEAKATEINKIMQELRTKLAGDYVIY